MESISPLLRRLGVVAAVVAAGHLVVLSGRGVGAGRLERRTF